MDDRAVARSAPGAPATSALSSRSVIVILDNAVQTDDAFTLTSDKGKRQTKKASDAQEITGTDRKKLTFALPSPGAAYTLVQTRGNGLKTTVFRGTPTLRLTTFEDGKPRGKKKQYYEVKTEPKDPSEGELAEPTVPYGNIVAKEPDVSGEEKEDDKAEHDPGYSVDPELTKEQPDKDRPPPPDGPEILLAYTNAIAVMSSQCRFVEWKVYGGGRDLAEWSPFGPFADRRGSWKEIEGERWIYVYRRDPSSATSGDWALELHVDASGSIATTPMDEAVDPRTGAPKEREKRAHPIALGTTISFARRANGHPQQYSFFATRIRLPAAAITAIGAHVSIHLPPVTFEADDVNIAGRDGNILLVPVLDPITIALHLHAYYRAAATDVLTYMAAPKRRDKRLLAELVQALVEPEVDPRNKNTAHLALKHVDVVHLKSPVPAIPVTRYRLKFLIEHDEQLAHRIGWRDRWCDFLSRWLRSDTMKILAEAHRHDAPGDFHKFLIPFGKCLVRTDESAVGRELLDELYSDKTHWVHQYFLPNEEPTALVAQTIRKSFSTVLEVIKAYTPSIVLRRALYVDIHIYKVVGYVFGDIVSGPGKTLHVPKPRVKQFGKYVTLPEGPTRLKPPATIDVLELQAFNSVTLREAYVDKPPPATSLRRLAALLEIINFVFAVKAWTDLEPDASAADKGFVIANLAGSLLDMTVLGLSFKQAASAEGREILERWAMRIGVVGGVIDTVLAVKDTLDAWKQGDTGGLIGSGMVAAGSFGGSVISVSTLLGWAGGGPYALGMLAVIGLGYATKLFFGDSDTAYEKFVAYCEWGDQAGKSSYQPDWAPAPYDAWIGNYALQVQAAVNVLCSFSVEPDLLLEKRTAHLQFGWVPAGATLTFNYTEVWLDGTVLSHAEQLVFDDVLGLTSPTGMFRIHKVDDNAYDVRPKEVPGERAVANVYPGAVLPLVPGGMDHTLLDKAPGLDKIWIAAQLVVNLGSTQYTFPNTGPQKTVLVS